MNDILVSIIIPTYKRPDFLDRAIQSVLSQSHKNVEVIIVDDNNDGDIYREETEALMQNFSDKRIKYIKHTKNKNGSAARNTGIKNATGKYVTFLDDDDEFETDKITEQLKCMESLDDDWVACYTLFTRYKNGMVFDRSIDCKSGDLYLDFFKNEIYICAGSNIFVRTSIARKINGFDESFKRMQDLEFLIRIAEQGKIKGINKYLLKVNFHTNQVKVDSNVITSHVNNFFDKFERRIKKLPKGEVNKVYVSKYLDIFRKLLLDKRFKEALDIKKKHSIKISLFLRYITYLIERKVTKKCYGFKIK